MTAPHPAPPPHRPITEFCEGLFYVTGSFTLGPGIRFERNMIIVKEGEALTLINAVRLSDAGEAALAALGTVTHLVKLGWAHDRDDPYYMETFSPTFWAPPGVSHRVPLSVDRELTEDGELPVPGARLLRFRNGAKPEVALVLPHAGGVLITCDAVQNQVDWSRYSLMAKLMMPIIGFRRVRAGIGPPWRKAMTVKGGASLKADFERLVEMEFQHLLPGHGPPLRDTANADLRATIDRTFG